MSEASELKLQVAALEDDTLQKLFSALFDEGQGANARIAFVNYCRNHNFHPSEMYILCGNNIFQRLRDMIKKQEKLLDEYRIANKYLLEEARRLNNGKMVLPPAQIMERASQLRQLIRVKFGSSITARRAACQALNVTGRQLAKLERGIDVSDGLIELLEGFPNQGPASPVSPTKRRSRQISNRRYEEFEKRFSYIPKPKKFGKNKSTMTPEELRTIAEIWFGEQWVAPLARFIGYDEYHITKFMEGDSTRSIREETAKYIRQVHHDLQASGGFTGAALPKSR